ncbi:MAG: hypothetical protein ABI665_03440 [Vicinamibacterales bacterium]
MTPTLLPLVFATAACLSAADSAQSVRTDPMRSEEIRVETAAGPVTAVAAEAAADVQFANGRTESGYVVGVYEPKSGVFWWRYEVRNPSVLTGPIERMKERVRFYGADARLVSFQTNGRFLNIRESVERVNSLQAGIDSALASLKTSLGEIESGAKEWFTRVDLSSLGHDFFLRPGNAAALDPPAVKSVSLSAGRWDVTLEGPNRDTAILTLDDKYAVVNVRRQPAPKP